MLDKLDMNLVLPRKVFKPVQREMLERIFELSEMVYEQKRPVIVVFEGWDAAGKGTTIRALTGRLDARGYKVLPTQAARTHEKQKPWLWRFWMNIPRYGQIAIFDRCWYGRVLVERVEGLTPVPEWIAAYEEINQFERTLADDGTIFLKFWLHITKQEQLRRFVELAQAPDTAWQVAEEDWEHHRKYDEYLAAVRDMLANTNTAYAPWHAVPATDREYRLYVVCHTIIRRLEEALKQPASKWPAPAELDAFNATREAEKEARKKAKKEAKKEAKEEAKEEAKKEEADAASNGANLAEAAADPVRAGSKGGKNGKNGKNGKRGKAGEAKEVKDVQDAKKNPKPKKQAKDDVAPAQEADHA
jgi:polyphosphate kinase 2 (PPK2 family)